MALNFKGIVPENKEKEVPEIKEPSPKEPAKEPDEVKAQGEVIPGELTDPVVAMQTSWIEHASMFMQAFELTNATNYFKKMDLVINEMSRQAMNHKITDKATFDQAIQMGTQAKKMDSELKKMVDQIKRPYLDYNNAVQGLYKKASTKLTGIMGDLKQRVLKEKPVYMPSKKPAAPPAPTGKGSAPPAPTSTNDERKKIAGASYKSKSVPKWELEDVSKVPMKYLTVNAVEVNKAVRAGARDIPGLRIWEEEDIDMRYNQ